MKYIDAEKLIAEIRELRSESCISESDDYYEYAKSEIIDIITSLQQEPRFPQYDNIVEKVFGAGNLEGWERDEAEMLVALAKEELLKSLQQEQPEVDLEKEIELWFDLSGIGEAWENGEWSINDVTRTARHFYALGLNARKEN